jgi:general secretion pathway protein B
MSFILDALKKSESERQRQGSPSMYEIKVAPPRSRFPVWAVVIGLLLGVNLLVLIAVLLLRDPAPSPAPVAGAAVPAAPAAAPPTPAATAAAVVAPVASAPLPVAAAPPADPATGRFNPPLVEDPDLGAEDYETELPEVVAGPALPLPPPAQRGSVTQGGLPDRDTLVSNGSPVPEARLSLHAYDRNAAARFVFLNGQRAREGDTLANGLRVEEIRPDGTVLSFRGSRFLVPIQ